jgi:hypothetical protein
MTTVATTEKRKRHRITFCEPVTTKHARDVYRREVINGAASVSFRTWLRAANPEVHPASSAHKLKRILRGR